MLKWCHFYHFQAHLEDQEKELLQMNQNRTMLEKNFNELIELRHVLQKDTSFFDETIDVEKVEQDTSEASQTTKPLVEKDVGVTTKAVKLGYEIRSSNTCRFITGVILRDKFNSFEKVLWRVLRGNLFMKHAEIEEKIKEPSSVFLRLGVEIIFF